MSGWEWIIEAHGCDAHSLTDPEALERMFERIIHGMQLNPVAPATWHQFPNTGGVTGLSLLAESHLACHTFPEFGSLCLNVFCCRPRPDWDFAADLQREFGADSVQIRKVERPYSS